MNCIQIAASQLCCAPQALQQHKAHFRTSSLGTKLPKILKLTTATNRHRYAAPVCLFGGKGKSEGEGSQDSPWKSIEKAVGKFGKDQSVEDVLRQQIQKQEFYDDGDSGGKDGGSGGGGGGNGGGFGEDENEGESIWEEVREAVLATLGFVFLYIYIIEGEEINVFVRDVLKFVFTRQKSIRLSRLIDQWQSFYKRMKEEKDYDPYWLEREILNTPTWFDSPDKYRYIIQEMERMESQGENDNYGDGGDDDRSRDYRGGGSDDDGTGDYYRGGDGNAGERPYDSEE
ncbi:uncharacterized protein LOC127246848 [Andrographis paniculata]|uniref:uncharacterized protein LOC127246848 n=1 Tax=Andrographis paniculata TaxID=175694 RepID=UPI0021E71C48|nr:uncharacterized protein LOC127246848 [Andrographis paniculata]XP_051124413.1 uncharacterized protein LOC127246848 [Andrographis paniculata]